MSTVHPPPAPVGKLGWIALTATLLLAALAGRGVAARSADDAGPSLTGSTGLVRLPSATVGGPGILRVAAYEEVVHAHDLVTFGDSETRLATNVGVAFTPISRLQFFGSLRLISDSEQQTAPGASPDSFHTFNAAGRLGAKILAFGRPWVATGAEAGVEFPADLAATARAASAWLSLLGSLQFDVASRIPVDILFDAGYVQDRSLNRYDFTGLSAADRQEVMFGYDMGVSRFRLAVGVDALIPTPTSFPSLRPFLEYHVDLARSAPLSTLADQTRDITGLQLGHREQKWATLGVRATLGTRISATIALDIALHSLGFDFGPPLPPYTLVIGVGAPFRFGT